MTFNEFLADLKIEFRQYYDANLIDEILVYKWVNQALKKFGSTIMAYQDAMITIHNNRGKLPENFFQLKAAILCEPDFIVCDKKDEPILFESHFWHDITMKQVGWEVCSGECREKIIEETTISDKFYINTTPFTKYYKRTRELRLGKSFNKSVCDSSCANKYNSSAPDEINIVGTTIHTNFKTGEIYMKFKGLELDEEGLVVIPDSPKGELQSYIMYFVKRNILEFIMSNGEDTNISNLFQYYVQQERMQFALAMTEAKFSNITPKSFYKLKIRPYLERQVFENRLH